VMPKEVANEIKRNTNPRKAPQDLIYNRWNCEATTNKGVVKLIQYNNAADWVLWTGLVWLRMVQVESSCELGTEPLGSIKCWESTEWLHILWPIEWYSAPQSLSVSYNNASFRYKYMPEVWKIADVIMIPKLGNQLNEVTSYRLMPLQLVASRLYEKLL
jgi:hypothetical protein